MSGGRAASGPRSDEERRRDVRRVAASFAAVVGLSAGTTAYFSGATGFEAGAVAAAGLVVGVALLFVVGR